MNADVVVIGGGPAGLWAGKTAAEFGLNVVILEEHNTVGSPKHCSGWLTGCEFTRELFNLIKDTLPHQKVSKITVIEPFSNRVREEVEDTGWGGYLVRREIFDRELARLALIAGAKLLVGVKAVELIKQDGQVVGVFTGSSRVPKVFAKLTICADGIKSATSTGFAKKEIALPDEADTYAGVQMELSNVGDVKPGEIEFYEADDPGISGRSLWPHANGITLASFSSIDAYFNARSRTDNAFSTKLSLSTPIYIGSFQNRAQMGCLYQRMVRDGAIFVGEAGGCAGIIHGMISGYYGAVVAKRVIESGDSSETFLTQFEKMIKSSDISKSPVYMPKKLRQFGSYRKWTEGLQKIKV